MESACLLGDQDLKLFLNEMKFGPFFIPLKIAKSLPAEGDFMIIIN